MRKSYRGFSMEYDDNANCWALADPYEQHLGYFATDRLARKHVDGLLGKSVFGSVVGGGIFLAVCLIMFKLFVKNGLAPFLADLGIGFN